MRYWQVMSAMVFLALLALPATAEGPQAPGKDMAQAVQQADTNHDGKVTFEEWKAARPNCTQERFNALDRNHDGALTKDDKPATPAGEEARPPLPAQGQAKPGKGAQAAKGERHQQLLAKLKEADKDNDGKVTFDEAKAVVPKLTQEHFNKLDRNHDGAISAADKPARPAGPGQDPQRRQQMLAKLKAADTNNDGKVTFEEAKAALPNVTQEQFNHFDRNHDGAISAADKPAKPEQPGAPGQDAQRRQQFLAKLKTADTNKDGKVTFEEARSVFPKLTRERFAKLDRNHDGAIGPDDRQPKR